jgi:hypothetical protein
MNDARRRWCARRSFEWQAVRAATGDRRYAEAQDSASAGTLSSYAAQPEIGRGKGIFQHLSGIIAPWLESGKKKTTADGTET